MGIGSMLWIRSHPWRFSKSIYFDHERQADTDEFIATDFAPCSFALAGVIWLAFNVVVTIWRSPPSLQSLRLPSCWAVPLIRYLQVINPLTLVLF